MQALAGDLLAEYTAYTGFKSVNENDNFSQATYVRTSLAVTASGSLLEDEPNCGLGVYVAVRADQKDVFIINFHGMSRPVDKRDDPNRLLQSKTLIGFLADKQQAVLGGDFNLLPETESIKLFAQHGYQDLIEEYNISTTRNQLAWDQYPEPKFEKQYYSDYVFLSPDSSLRTFTVPDGKVSDHLPLEVVIDE